MSSDMMQFDMQELLPDAKDSETKKCEEIIYCYSVILLSLVKIWKADVEIIYSLVLTSLSRKQPVDLLSVNLFVKS